jgi:hypothetical protein
MIRALLTLALPILALGAGAASLAGEGVLLGAGGEPIMVRGAEAPLQKASFSEGCNASPFRAAEALADAAGAERLMRIIEVVLADGPEGIAVSIHEIPADESAAAATLVFVLDASGKVLFAAAAPAPVADTAGAAIDAGCELAPAELLGSI